MKTLINNWNFKVATSGLMLKNWVRIMVSAMFLLSATSCATVLTGRPNEYQTTKPAPGEPQREIRVGALMADIILFWPGAVIDFATGAIYKPAPTIQQPQLTRAERKDAWQAKRARLLAERDSIRAERAEKRKNRP